MKVEEIKIGYSAAIPLAPYGVKDNAWAEIKINTEGQPYNHFELFSRLKNEVDSSIKKLYPHLFQDQSIEPVVIRGNFHVPEFSEETLRSCTDLKVLSIYEFIIDKKPEGEEKRKLWLIYDEVYAKLSNQTK